MTAARSLLVLVIATLGLAAGGAARPAAVTPRPNILVIETDDQTVASLKAMPNVGRLLAARGVTFLNNVVANSLCCPSRATFLTGQYSHNNGVWDNAPPTGGYDVFRATEGNSLAVWLHTSGYTTIELGKYLNGYGTNESNVIPPGWTDWNADVGGTWNDYYGVTLNENGTRVSYAGLYQTDVFSDKAVELIRKHSSTTHPFFFWLNFVAPHTGKPRTPTDQPQPETAIPAAQDEGYFSWLPLPKPPSYNEADVSDKPARIQALLLIDAATEAGIRLAHQRELESLLAVDRAVARIVAVLRAAHALDRTVIVFTSDNGFMNGEHRIFNDKEVVYEPSIRVPLIISGPGIPAHRVVRTLVSNIDLAPTFVEIAGAKAGRSPDGRSLVPLLRSPSLRWKRDLLVESPLRHHDRVFTAIRTDRYLYAEYANGDRELYDLVRDPYELASVHADPTYASVRSALAARLAKLRKCRGGSCRA